jgi:hypothetical protein
MQGFMDVKAVRVMYPERYLMKALSEYQLLYADLEMIPATNAMNAHAQDFVVDDE